jgi:hypothetical protein
VKFKRALTVGIVLLVPLGTLVLGWSVGRFGKGPGGMYDCPELGVEGYSYWLFKSGRVFVVSPEVTVAYGVYERGGKGWEWINQNGDRYRLEPGIFSLGVLDSNSVGVETAPFRRIWLPPEWFSRTRADKHDK